MARIYQIPTNFQQSGYAFNGMIAVRNLVDAAVLFLIGIFVASLFPFEGYSKLSGYILIGGLFAIVGVTGINGVPCSTYLIDFYRWTKRRKPYLYNTHGGVYTISSADLLLNEPQLRDSIADAIDSMKEAMMKNQPDYIEGETFEFADDPELVALKDAEQRMMEEQEEKRQEELSKKEADARARAEAEAAAVAEKQPEPKPAAPKPIAGINVKSIMQNITPNDSEEGGG